MSVTATEKVLQRKDGSTLIVGVVLALAFLQFIATVTGPLTAKIMGQDTTQAYAAPATFNDQYTTPFVALLLQLVAVELVIWLIIGIRALVSPKTVSKKKK